MSRQRKGSGLASLVADSESGSGEVSNPDGVKYVRYRKTNSAPKRRGRSIYIQDSVWQAMEDLSYEQKRKHRRRAPEIWEKAAELAIEFYKSQDDNLAK